MGMERVVSGIRRAGPFLFVLTLLLNACGSTEPALSTSRPPDSTNTDSTTPPPDSLPTDTTPVTPPPDTTGSVVPVHNGIPFGPFALPSNQYSADFNGAYRPGAWAVDSLLIDLEAARRANTRVLINLTGPKGYIDADGFNLDKWKEKVDRFRGVDFTSYIADGTIVGHFLLDEPGDPSNFNGDKLTPAEVDEMARYSKEIWPTMAAIVRAWPDYLKGYEYKYLDAAWAQYHSRFGDINQFIANNVRDAKASGLALITGLNVLNGGTSSSGIPGRNPSKYAMSASEIRSWGGALLAEPYMCAFFIWKYDSKYFSRPDIQAALLDLNHQAEAHGKQECRKAS